MRGAFAGAEGTWRTYQLAAPAATSRFRAMPFDEQLSTTISVIALVLAAPAA